MDIDSQHGDPMQYIQVKRHNDEVKFDYITSYRLYEIFVLMGCKAKDAIIATQRLFEAVAQDRPLIDWNTFHDRSHEVLASLNYLYPNHLLHLHMANSIRQKRTSFIVLMAGTSGTGKSTLASLLATKLGVNTVLSTDSVRHAMRSYTSRTETPVLFVSTYQAGDALADGDETEDREKAQRRRVLKGYKAQSDVVIDNLDRIITLFEEQHQSLIIEGVHLRPDQIIRLVRKHPTCIPFVVYISNPQKHRERFAVRAKNMAVDPKENKYIQYFDNIRIIQNQFCKGADKYLIPKIDNTNVDRSVATIHSTLIRVLRKIAQGGKIFDDVVGKFVTLSREHESTRKSAWSSTAMERAMRPFLRQKVSKRILLRRLISEQRQVLSDGADSSSSSSGEEDEASEDDGQTTVVPSLFSAGYKGNDESEEEMDDFELKRSKNLEAALHHATQWTAGQVPGAFSSILIEAAATETFSDNLIDEGLSESVTNRLRREWIEIEQEKNRFPNAQVDSSVDSAAEDAILSDAILSDDFSDRDDSHSCMYS